MGDPDSFDGWRISLARRVFLTPVGPLAVASLPFHIGFHLTGHHWMHRSALGDMPRACKRSWTLTGMHCQHWKTWEDLRTFSPLREELLTQRKA